MNGCYTGAKSQVGERVALVAWAKRDLEGPEFDLLHCVGFAAEVKKKKNNQMLQALNAYKCSLAAVKV